MGLNSAHVLTDEGDITLTWDPAVPDDRANMKELFAQLLQSGYEAYVVSDTPTNLERALGCKYTKKRTQTLDAYIGKLIMRKKVVVAPATVLGGYPKPGMNEGRL